LTADEDSWVHDLAVSAIAVTRRTSSKSEVLTSQVSTNEGSTFDIGIGKTSSSKSEQVPVVSFGMVGEDPVDWSAERIGWRILALAVLSTE